MKVVGNPGKLSHRERFNRLQKRANLLSGGLPYGRGVRRFHSHEELEAWRMEQIRKYQESRKKMTS